MHNDEAGGRPLWGYVALPLVMIALLFLLVLLLGGPGDDGSVFVSATPAPRPTADATTRAVITAQFATQDALASTAAQSATDSAQTIGPPSP